MPFVISLITREIQHLKKKQLNFDRGYVRIKVVLTLVKLFNNNSIQLFILLAQYTAIGPIYSAIRKNKQKCGGNNTQI
jgi:hypothetical protein